MLKPARVSNAGLELAAHGDAHDQAHQTLQSPPDNIPGHIRQFIHERIGSVEVLEVLLLLFADPADEWTALEVSRKLCTSVESARSRLEELAGAKLLVSINTEPVKYRFNRENAAALALVAELEKTYKERRVSVISLIYSRPSEPLRAFSDAFRLRKDET